jgi:hypothetical protein
VRPESKENNNRFGTCEASGAPNRLLAPRLFRIGPDERDAFECCADRDGCDKRNTRRLSRRRLLANEAPPQTDEACRPVGVEGQG